MTTPPAAPAPAPVKKGPSAVLIVVIVLIVICVLVPICIYFGLLILGNSVGNSLGNVFSEMVATLGTPAP
jgi:hypothetical protein